MKVGEVLEEINTLRELYKTLDAKLCFYKDIQDKNPAIEKVCKETTKKLSAINIKLFNYLDMEVK